MIINKDLTKSAAVVLAAFLAACGGSDASVECAQNADCNLGAGGLCEVNPPTNNQWCTYPCGEHTGGADPDCVSSRCWSNFDVGDGVGGTCVVYEDPDGGIDPPDASIADAGIIDAMIPDGRVPDARIADAFVPDAMLPTMGQSCDLLTPSCGPGGNNNCCANSVATGGLFFRSYDAAPDMYNDISNPAMVSDFRLDSYEITVGRFRAFVNAGKGIQGSPPIGGSGAHATLAGSGWNSSWNGNLPANTTALTNGLSCNVTSTWTPTPGANEHKPISCITWYEAMAFCIWDGGYLPTEAEWNYAAAGGINGRAYPWSNPFGSTTISSAYAVYFPSGNPANVGSKSPTGDGRWGHADLAGNLFEWTLDGYSATFPDPDSCTDCANLSATGKRVYRGGVFYLVAESLRTPIRAGADPTFRGDDFGARCARMP